MKRYLIFAGDSYYPNGGLNDYIISYDNIKEVDAWINTQRGVEEDRCLYDWWHILDTANGCITKYCRKSDDYIEETTAFLD